jgi:hypothetical protein
LKVTIDLKDDKIMLPLNKFFIVVEWLKIIRNEVVELEVIQKLERVRKNGNQLTQDDSRYTIMYQPFLIAFSGPQATHGWVAIDNVNWVALKLNLNIALAATIIY